MIVMAIIFKLLVIGTMIITVVKISVTYCMVKIKEQTQQKYHGKGYLIFEKLLKHLLNLE